MSEFLVFISATIVLSFFIEYTYIGNPGSIATKYKDHFCCFIIFVILTLFVGLRRNYNDTYTYIVGYNNSLPFPDLWKHFNAELGANPGFVLVQAWLRTNAVSDQGFLLLFSAISVGCSVYFLKKYSTNFVLSLFLYFATNSYLLTAAAIKQSAAIALSLIAITFALRKRWFIFAFIVALAATFHPYVLLYVLIPILMFKPWTKKTYIMLGIFVVAGFALESLLGTIVDVTSMIGDSYTEDSFVGEGINIFRVLVANVPLILTFLYRKRFFTDSTKTENLMVNLSTLNGAIMFVGMFGTAIYFSRMASYFTIMQCVTLPWILNRLPRRRQIFYTSAMIIGYTLFFLYANTITISFGNDFQRITLIEYLSQLYNF